MLNDANSMPIYVESFRVFPVNYMECAESICWTQSYLLQPGWYFTTKGLILRVWFKFYQFSSRLSIAETRCRKCKWSNTIHSLNKVIQRAHATPAQLRSYDQFMHRATIIVW